jgi:hypothetical protein
MTVAKHIPADFACTACGSKTPFEIAIQHDGASRVVTRCLHALGDFGHGLLAYAALFRPRKKRLTWEKVYRVVDDVLAMRDAGYIDRDGERIIVTEPLWIESFAAIADAAQKSLTLPIESHGYLLEILARKGKQANAAKDRDAESIARGDTPVGYSAAHAPAFPARVQSYNQAMVAPAAAPPRLPPPPPAPRAPIPDNVLDAIKESRAARRLGTGGFPISGDVSTKAATTPADEAAISDALNQRPERDSTKDTCFARIGNSKQLVEIIKRFEKRGKKTVLVQLLDTDVEVEPIIIDAKDLL